MNSRILLNAVLAAFLALGGEGAPKTAIAMEATRVPPTASYLDNDSNSWGGLWPGPYKNVRPEVDLVNVVELRNPPQPPIMEYPWVSPDQKEPLLFATLSQSGEFQEGYVADVGRVPSGAIECVAGAFVFVQNPLPELKGDFLDISLTAQNLAGNWERVVRKTIVTGATITENWEYGFVLPPIEEIRGKPVTLYLYARHIKHPGFLGSFWAYDGKLECSVPSVWTSYLPIVPRNSRYFTSGEPFSN